MDSSKRREIIIQQISEIKEKTGKSCLVAVSKYYPASDVYNAYLGGQKDFGESRVQGLRDKVMELGKIDNECLNDISWHFIGHLQTNKINMLLKIPRLEYIHSVDSVNLLKTLYEKENIFTGESLNFFLQVNTSGEDEKSGVEANYESLLPLIKLISLNPDSKLKFYGLMSIGRIRTDDFENDARNGFRLLKSIRDRITKEFPFPSLKLSMGMSNDYLIALEEGSDFLRIGSSIFSLQ